MSKRGNGEGTKITRLPDGRWWTRVTLPDGKRKAFYGAAQREVREKRDAYLAELRAGRISTDAAQRTGKYLRDWLKSCRTIKPATRQDYERQVELATPLHKVRLDQLKAAHVQALYDALTERGLSATSVVKVHRVLRIAFRRAVKLGYILRAPTEMATPPKPDYVERPTLSAEQVRAFLESTKDHRLHALWVVILMQGLRSGEACGLRWQDIDFEAQRLNVRQTTQRLRGLGIVAGTPKTARSRRTLDLLPATVDALRAHRIRQLEERMAAPDWERAPQWADQVFTTMTGGPLEPGALGYPIRRILATADLAHMRVHDLRHTYATLLSEAGCDLIDVQHALGHSSYHLTADTYTHARKERRSPATAHMEQLFPATKEVG